MRRTTVAPVTRSCSAGPTGRRSRAGASGDAGARDYLAGHDAALVECGDLATGADVDTQDLRGRLSPTGQCGVSNPCPGIRVGWQSQPSPHTR